MSFMCDYYKVVLPTSRTELAASVYYGMAWRCTLLNEACQERFGGWERGHIDAKAFVSRLLAPAPDYALNSRRTPKYAVFLSQGLCKGIYSSAICIHRSIN